MAVWRERREDDGAALVSTACLSHARVCHEVTWEKGKLKDFVSQNCPGHIQRIETFFM